MIACPTFVPYRFGSIVYGAIFWLRMLSLNAAFVRTLRPDKRRVTFANAMLALGKLACSERSGIAAGQAGDHFARHLSSRRIARIKGRFRGLGCINASV